MTPERRPTVISSWGRLALDALRAQGIDVRPTLAAAGFAEDAFDDPNGRHPVESIARLWHVAAKHSGDPAFGLRVAKQVRSTSLHALGYAILASATLGSALERAARFCELVVDAGVLELERSDAEATLRIVTHKGYEAGGIELRDAVLSILVRSMRGLSGGAFVLSSVELHRKAGTDFTPYQRLFGCPVTWGRHDLLRMPAAILDARLVAPNPELARFNDGAASEYLRSLSEPPMVDRVRSAIRERLSEGVTPESVARKLGMSLRSLQRGLQASGTSYEDVLREVRLELARTHLRDRRRSTSEVASLLGYDSASAFARAFRRWTGTSPSGYLEQLERGGR